MNTELKEIVKLHLGGDLISAETGYRKLIDEGNTSHVVYGNLGSICVQTERAEEAIPLLHQALSLKPDYALGYYNLGLALQEIGKTEDAITAYRSAIQLKPDYVDAYNNLGGALQDLKALDDAIAAYQTVIQLQPNYAEAYNNLGACLICQDKVDQAIAILNYTLEQKPDLVDAYNNLALALIEQKTFDQAAQILADLLSLEPDYHKALSCYIHCCAQLFAIDSAQPYIDKVYSLLSANALQAFFSPWTLLYLQDATPQIQKKAAFQYAYSKLNLNYLSPLPLPKQRTNHGKIRLGYISADFTDHPVMYLVADVLQNYSRSKFEVYCYSITKNPTGELREKVKHSVDKFVELSQLSDPEVAQHIATDQLDILVDLTGYTRDGRPGIIARRPAPIIVNWLGYAGTLGHPQMADYIIGDPIVTPLGNEDDFSERIIQMPHCYLPAPYPPLENIPSRVEVGLPEDKIVFCSFNQCLKISPSCFEVWCRILSQVPESLLWLSQYHPVTQQNILEKARINGIAPSRIIFAPRTPTREEHLARLTLADIALDTFPYNSHSTGADVLWAGVPMVTILGETFAARVGASLVTAVGLPELVTTSLDAYCELAVKLALDPQARGELRTKLWNNRTTHPLFHTQQFITDLEKLYQQLVGEWGVVTGEW